MIGYFIVATLAATGSCIPSVGPLTKREDMIAGLQKAPSGGFCGKNEAAGGSVYGCFDDNPCCSSAGYCGKTTDYCNVNCQQSYSTTCELPSNPTPPTVPESEIIESDTLCGVHDGKTYKCTKFCCSEYGYCGNGDAWCGAMCQKTFANTCEIDESAPLNNPDQGRCGKDSSCSKDDPCCSSYGYCGRDSKYCAETCQPQYSFEGKCWKPLYEKPKPCGDKQKVKTPWTGGTPGQPARCGLDKKTGKEYGCNGEIDGCCSKDGYCGHEYRHCNLGCQVKYSSMCALSATPLSPETKPPPPPGSYDGKLAPPDCYVNKTLGLMTTDGKPIHNPHSYAGKPADEQAKNKPTVQYKN